MEPRYNKVLGITNDFFTPEIVKFMKKNLDTTKPRYSEQMLPVRWPFVILRFFFMFCYYGVRKKTEVALYYDFGSLLSPESIACVTVVQFWSVPRCHVTLALGDVWTFEKVLRPILMTCKGDLWQVYVSVTFRIG